MLDDGLWEADARLELEDLPRRSTAPSPKTTRSTRSAGWPSCLPGTFRPRASSSNTPRAGGSKRWMPIRGESSACASTPRKARACRRRASSFANSFAGSAIALNSSALPAGSSKNIVACSPGSPAKRTVGGMTNSMPAPLQPLRKRLPIVHRQHEPEMRHRHILAVDRIGRTRPHRVRAQGERRSDDRRDRSRPSGRHCGLPGSRAARRRSSRAAARSSTGKARWNGGRLMRRLVMRASDACRGFR